MDDIRKTQESFARKAQMHPEHKFGDLYHLICREDWLRTALEKVLSNPGSRTAGIDKISRKDLKEEEQKTAFIRSLQTELKDGMYCPQPVKRRWIPKANGKQRPLGISTLKDRVVQMVLKMLLEPIWESDFLDCSKVSVTDDARWTVFGSVKVGLPPRTNIYGLWKVTLKDVTTTQLNTPFHNPKHELGTIIEVTDPTHPLFGRKFPLLSYSTQPDAQFALVAYQEGNMTLRIALEATNLGFAQPRVSTRLTLAALEDLLSAAEEVLCPQSPTVSGSISPPNCDQPSRPNSRPSSRK